VDIRSRLAHAWNAFTGQNAPEKMESYGLSTSFGRPDRVRFAYPHERSIVSAIYTRLVIDCAAVDIRHVRLDDSDRYQEDIVSGLNDCLTVEANLDQAARAFRQDLFMTLFDRGVAAIVPVDTTINPNLSGSFDILTLRVGEIKAWKPRHVKVSVYNEAKGKREDVIVDKKFVAIIENPLYAVMNETNSTLQRLIRKLNLLDGIDENVASGKLDLIIQLPYVVKSDIRRQQAEQRRRDIEFQLSGSKYGVAYTDGTEKVIQLNRPVDNQLMGQIEFLIKMLYGQLGVTDEIMNGTADEKTMTNYYNRTVEPVVSAAVNEMKRKFLTKTGRTQKQSIMFFWNPFKLVPIGGENGLADAIDKLSRNEVITSNEGRQWVGLKPSNDPKADKLMNSNMPQPNPASPETPSQPVSDGAGSQS
jgi:putative sterol carrier protein